MWYTSKEIREILKISNQHLYELKKHNKIVYKKIPNTKKYLFQYFFISSIYNTAIQKLSCIF
jgi:hypothetical protein